MTARIAIVSAFHLSRNPRVLKEATLLGHAGYEVTVIHVSAHPGYEALDQRLLGMAPFRRLKIDYLSRQPVARAAAFSQRLRVWLARKLNRRFDLNFAAALGPGTALRRAAARINPDLTIVHTEAAAWAGVQLLRRGWQVAADFEDWYSEDLLPGDRRYLPGRKLREIEGELLRRAAFVTTTSAAMAAALQERYGGPPPVVVTNCFPLDPAPGPRPPDRPPRLVWFSQTVGAGRGLEAFLSAWSLHPDPPSITLIGEPVTGYRESLLGGLPDRLHSRVILHPWVEPDALPALLATFDVGLALEPREPRNKDLTISNKILQYLNAGLAVLASDTAGQREVLAHSPDAGIVIAPEDRLGSALALERLVGNRTALARRQTAARKLAEDVYCWEKESSRLLATIERALVGRNDPGTVGGRVKPQPFKRRGRAALQGLVRRALRLRHDPYDFSIARTALVIAPHDDDASLGCGSLIARKRDHSHPVHVLYLTNGDASHPHHPNLPPPALAALRRSEAAAAMAVLGVDPAELTFLDAADGTLDRIDTAAADHLVDRIAAVLVRVRPDEVFLPCRRDGSSEHEAGFDLVRRAIRRTGLTLQIFEYPIWSLWNPFRLLRPLLVSRRVWSVAGPDHSLRKQRAVSLHLTQVEPTPPWQQVVLPPDFVKIFLTGEEFFFENRPEITPGELAL